MTDLESWLRLSTRDPAAYSFEVIDSAEDAVQDADLDSCLGDMLYDAMVDPELVAWLFDKGLPGIARQTILDHCLPIKITTAVGDFGEVLTGNLLDSHEGLSVPIGKLRYRESAKGPMKLTDVFAIGYTDSSAIGALCFCSVKTATTKPNADIAVNGYSQLEDDHRVERPEILSFWLRVAIQRKDESLATRIANVLGSREDPIPRNYRLALLIDNEVWDEAVLERLEDEEPTLPQFKTYLIQVRQLRDLIDRAYAQAKLRVDGLT